MISDVVLAPRVASFLERRGRFLLALFALAMAAIVASTWESDELDRGLLLARARFAGLPVKRHEPLVVQLDREADPGERRIAAARVLFAGRTEIQGKVADTIDRRVRKLEAIETVAGEALELLPASWEAALLLGAARFEKQLAARDTRLFSAAERWELPMSAAVARSRGGSMAERSLAAAYLEVYPALSAERRPQVAQVLRNSFADLYFRRRQVQRWLEVAGSLANAEQLLPADSDTLATLATAAWNRSDPSSALEYWAKQRRQLRNEVAATLDAALHRPGTLGNTPAATFAWIIARSAVDQEFVPFVQQALAKLPVRRVIDPQLTQAATRWLAWAQSFCLLSTCPLDPASFEKLAALAAPKVDTETAAFAALAAGDRPRAEKLAKNTGALATEAWANYVLFAAKRHLEQNEPGKAALLLNRAHPSAQERPIWVALDRKTGQPERAGTAALLRQESWGPAKWRREPDWMTLELGVGRRSSGLRLDLADAAKSDLLLGLEWDGRLLDPRLVRVGERSLHLALDVAPGIHLLRLWVKAGKLPPLGVTTLD